MFDITSYVISVHVHYVTIFPIQGVESEYRCRSLSPAKSPIPRFSSVDKEGVTVTVPDVRDEKIKQLEDKIKVLREKLTVFERDDDTNDTANGVEDDDDVPSCIFTSMRAHQVDHHDQGDERADQGDEGADQGDEGADQGDEGAV